MGSETRVGSEPCHIECGNRGWERCIGRLLLLRCSDELFVHDAKMGTHGSTPAAQATLAIEHETQTAHTGRQAPKVYGLSTVAALHNADR